MNNKIIWALMLFAMFFIGLQTAQPAAAVTKIDQFAVYHMGGQDSDADVIKVYRYSLNHVYITFTGYMWKPKLHKYVKIGTYSWVSLRKISSTKIRIAEPQITSSALHYTYHYTKHSATYYYWHTFKYKLKHSLPY
jgi:hypothetical protein